MLKIFKKTLFIVGCFLLISIVIKPTYTMAGTSEKQEMQRQLRRGEITQDEYNDWLDEYEAESEENDEGSGWFNPMELITGIIDGIKNLIKDFFENTIGDLISTWITDILNTVDFKTVSKTALAPEEVFSVFGTIFNGLYRLFMSLSLSLLILKTLMYGFNVYILWRNGSPDENPIEMITRYIFAIALILSFNDLYKIIINISTDILNNINNLVVPHLNVSELILSNMFAPGVNFLFTVIFIVIFIIEYIKGLVTLASKGIELFILRLGSSIAIISATTPQASIFNQYISAIIKQILSIFIMTISLNISLTIIADHPNLLGFLWASAAIKQVNKASSLLSQFTTTPNQGGGGAGMMMQMANMARMAITTAATGTPK